MGEESAATVTYAEGAEETLQHLRRSLPPTLDITKSCQLLGISKSSGYALAARGAFPCRVLRVGGSYRVITASLMRVLEGEAAA